MELFDIDLHRVFSYKYIFNPTMSRNDDGTFKLICRVQDHEDEGFLGICDLDEHFRPISEGRLVKSSPMHSRKIMLEDPRIFKYEDKLYIYYVESNPSLFYLSCTVFGMVVNDKIVNPIVINYKKNKKAHATIMNSALGAAKKMLPQKEWLIEKNWQIFVQHGRYFCVYKASEKHNVFEFDPHNGRVLSVYNTYCDLPWRFGRISGGASPVMLRDQHYYSFFHSWTTWDEPMEKKTWLQRKYHIGVYVFESLPPFRIKMITSAPLFSGSDYERLAPSGHSVVFPGSAVYDEMKEEWMIATGWNDHSCKLLRIKHTEIEEKLVPVNSVPMRKAMAIKTRIQVDVFLAKILRRIKAFNVVQIFF